MGTPQLNIKDAEATSLARKLAELTGESQTEAVRTALRQRLDRERENATAKTKRNAEERTPRVRKDVAKIYKIQERVRRRGVSAMRPFYRPRPL